MLKSSRIKNAKFSRYCFSICISVPFKKGFDTIEFKMLIGTLEYCGKKGIAKDPFCSYLAKRKQFASVNNHNSKIQIILTGIPQGSVLGPFLCLITSMSFQVV